MAKSKKLVKPRVQRKPRGKTTKKMNRKNPVNKLTKSKPYKKVAKRKTHKKKGGGPFSFSKKCKMPLQKKIQDIKESYDTLSMFITFYDKSQLIKFSTDDLLNNWCEDLIKILSSEKIISNINGTGEKVDIEDFYLNKIDTFRKELLIKKEPYIGTYKTEAELRNGVSSIKKLAHNFLKEEFFTFIKSIDNCFNPKSLTPIPLCPSEFIEKLNEFIDNMFGTIRKHILNKNLCYSHNCIQDYNTLLKPKATEIIENLKLFDLQEEIKLTEIIATLVRIEDLLKSINNEIVEIVEINPKSENVDRNDYLKNIRISLNRRLYEIEGMTSLLNPDFKFKKDQIVVVPEVKLDQIPEITEAGYSNVESSE